MCILTLPLLNFERAKLKNNNTSTKIIVHSQLKMLRIALPLVRKERNPKQTLKSTFNNFAKFFTILFFLALKSVTFWIGSANAIH